MYFILIRTYFILNMNGKGIESVNSLNFLGLMLSTILRIIIFGHISHKVSRVIGVIFFLKHTFPTERLIHTYNSLLVCHFNYCLTLWDSNIDSLHLLQKKDLGAMTYIVLVNLTLRLYSNDSNY